MKNIGYLVAELRKGWFRYPEELRHPIDQKAWEAADALEAQAAEIERLERERDEVLACNRGLVRLNEACEARAIAAEAELAAVREHARECMDAQSEIDESWDTIGTRANRGVLTLPEQIASLCRELDDGSFYKESDIDALQSRATAAEAEAARLRETLRMVVGCLEPGDDEAGSALADFSAAQVRQIEAALTGRKP